MKFLLRAMIVLVGLLSACSDNTPETQPPRPAMTTAFQSQLALTVEVYLELKDAMVTSEPEIARQKADALVIVTEAVPSGDLTGELKNTWQNELAALKSASEQIKTTEDLEKQRKAFAQLSTVVIEIARDFGPLEKPLYVLHCPMAFDNQGADWLSNVKDVKNPYFGDKMLKCGVVADSISVQ